jgi:hypothetical protein
MSNLFHPQQMDEVIESTDLPAIAKRILVHTIRTANNMVYRDAMLLQNAFEPIKHERLTVRVCRMHWYREHWRKVKLRFQQITGTDLVNRFREFKGEWEEWGKLMAAIASK